MEGLVVLVIGASFVLGIMSLLGFFDRSDR